MVIGRAAKPGATILLNGATIVGGIVVPVSGMTGATSSGIVMAHVTGVAIMAAKKSHAVQLQTQPPSGTVAQRPV